MDAPNPALDTTGAGFEASPPNVGAGAAPPNAGVDEAPAPKAGADEEGPAPNAGADVAPAPNAGVDAGAAPKAAVDAGAAPKEGAEAPAPNAGVDAGAAPNAGADDTAPAPNAGADDAAPAPNAGADDAAPAPNAGADDAAPAPNAGADDDPPKVNAGMDDGVDDDGAPKVNATPPEVAGVSFGSETVDGLELGAGAGFPNVKGAGEDAGASEGALDPGSEVASALADPNSPVPDVLGAESIAAPKANAAPVDVGASGFDELVSFREAAWMGKEVPNETSGFAVSLVTAGSVVAASDTGVDETPKVNGAAVAFRGDGVVDGAPNVKGAGAAAGFAAASAVEAGADVPKENGDGDVDAVRGDGAGSVAFFSSSSIASCTFF